MTETSKRMKALLRQHAGRAWEAEMKAALGTLAARFRDWEAGRLSSSDLHTAIHEYHDGVGREIWKRFATNNPKVPLAHAVAAGVVAKESLPAEVQEHISGMVEFFQAGEQEQDS
jgi:hypothetical protein